MTAISYILSITNKINKDENWKPDWKDLNTAKYTIMIENECISIGKNYGVRVSFFYVSEKGIDKLLNLIPKWVFKKALED